MKIFEIVHPWDLTLKNGTIVHDAVPKAEEVTDPIELDEFHKEAIDDGFDKVLWNEVTYKIQCKTAEQALKKYEADMAYEAWASCESYGAEEASHD